MGELLEKSHNLIDSIPTTLLLTDVQSRILCANRQAESFFGYPREEIEGKQIRFLFPEEDLTYFLPNILYLTRFKEGFSGEALLKQKDGNRIFAHLVSSSFREGGEIFLSFVFQEIQRLKKLEREMEEEERWAGLGRMAEEIAHQFRNPLASIGGYAHRIMKGVPPSSKGQVYLTQILEEVARLETILRRIEEYAQLAESPFQEERIQEVVESVIADLPGEKKEKKIPIQLDNSGLTGDGRLFINRDLIGKVVSHILENSLEAVRRKLKQKFSGAVKISLFDDEENVVLSVTDRGEGIAAKNLNLIFDPFFTTRPDRVGLGLTFVRRVMEEHGGSVRVASQLGKWTTVTLHFPKDRRRKIRRKYISPEAIPQNGES